MKLKNSKHKVAVFCGSMFGSNKKFKDLAISVTKYLAQNDYDIVYGGGENGLMGVVAKTALKYNAHVTGIIPSFLDKREERDAVLHFAFSLVFRINLCAFQKC